MKWGFYISAPRDSIDTIFCREGQIHTEMHHARFGGSRFIGLGAVRGTNLGLCL
jgi:hypothetical protein